MKAFRLSLSFKLTHGTSSPDSNADVVLKRLLNYHSIDLYRKRKATSNINVMKEQKGSFVNVLYSFYVSKVTHARAVYE